MRDSTAKLLSTMHRVAYRTSGGRLGKRLVNNRMLLLTTIGRRSGRRHTVPLLFLEDGAAVVVIASWGGRDYPPHWYLNLKANPGVIVQVEDRRWHGIASDLEEPERSEWWERATTAYAGYVEYQARTDRVIPVVRIEPAE